MPGPLPKAVAKKVKGALGGKAKTMPIIYGKNYKEPERKLMPYIVKPSKRRKMSEKYGHETASYHTRKKASVERKHLGMKEKPGRY